MDIKVRVYSVDSESKLKAFVSVTADELIVMNGFKLIERTDGKLFLANPTNKIKNGEYIDVTYFLKKDCHNYVEELAIKEYNRIVNNKMDKANPFAK